MKITAELLRQKNACTDQGELFERHFPNGVEVSEALCLKHYQDFDWDWAADNLLSDAAQEEYNKARAVAFARASEVSE